MLVANAPVGSPAELAGYGRISVSKSGLPPADPPRGLARFKRDVAASFEVAVSGFPGNWVRVWAGRSATVCANPVATFSASGKIIFEEARAWSVSAGRMGKSSFAD